MVPSTREAPAGTKLAISRRRLRQVVGLPMGRKLPSTQTLGHPWLTAQYWEVSRVMINSIRALGGAEGAS